MITNNNDNNNDDNNDNNDCIGVLPRGNICFLAARRMKAKESFRVFWRELKQWFRDLRPLDLKFASWNCENWPCPALRSCSQHRAIISVTSLGACAGALRSAPRPPTSLAPSGPKGPQRGNDTHPPGKEMAVVWNWNTTEEIMTNQPWKNMALRPETSLKT